MLFEELLPLLTEKTKHTVAQNQGEVNRSGSGTSRDRLSPQRVVTSGVISGPFGRFNVTTWLGRTASGPDAGARGCSRGEVARYVA
jgi:hypothetical protein